MKSIRIKFWGVRGSIPTPGPSTLKYGGNTPCIELHFADGPMFILDAGTGIRQLGRMLLNQAEPIRAYIFISHFHWDHIQGLPFFRPAFKPGNQITILGSDDTSLALDQIIAFQMNPTYFPVAIEDMKSDIRFRSLREEQLRIEGVDIQTIYLNHPGYTLGFRFSYRGKSVVYISDNEPFQNRGESSGIVHPPSRGKKVEDLFDNFVEDKNDRFIHFCRSADVLIHDSQYFEEEYRERVTWGHSPLTFPVDLAVQSGVKELILFHHDPDHSDDIVDKKLAMARRMIETKGSRLQCQAAREGWAFEI